VKKDPRIFIEHIIECIERIEDYVIEDYVKNVTKGEFLKSTQLQDAVEYVAGTGRLCPHFPPSAAGPGPGLPLPTAVARHSFGILKDREELCFSIANSFLYIYIETE